MRFSWPRSFHPGRWGETKLPPRLGRRSLSPATELQTENIRAIFPRSCKQQLSRICGAFQVFAQSNHVCNFRSPCWFFSLPFLSGEPSCQAWVSLESGRRPGAAVLRVSSAFGQRAVSSPHWWFSLLFLFFPKLSVGPLYSYWLARSSYQAFSPQLGTHKNRNRNETRLFCPWRLTQGHPVRQSPGRSCLGDGSGGGVSESRSSSDSFTPCQCRAVQSGPEPRE